jgi:tetratricopeptide (TPR) repeat protein
MKRLATYLLLSLIAVTTAFADAYDQMKEAFEAKDFITAEKFIEAATTENNEDYEVFLMAGDIYLEMEKKEEALNMYNKAEDLEGDEPDIMRRLGRVNSQLGNFALAIEQINEAIDEEEDNPENYLTLANVYIIADSLSQAELAIQKAQNLDDENPRAFLVLGDLYFQRRVYELARQNYERALELDNDLIDARMKLATSYYWLGTRQVDDDLANELFTKSLSEWNKITKQDTNNATAFFEQGKIFYLSKQHDNAAKSLNRYVMLRPDAKLGRWWLAQSLEKVGRCDSAATHLRIVSEEIDSVRVKAKMLLARCYFDNENYEKAIEEFERVRKDTTIEVVDMQKLGQAYLQLQDTNKALQTWEEAVKIAPEENCRFMDQMGYIYQRRGDYSDAIRILDLRLKTETCGEDKIHIVYYLIGQSYLLDTAQSAQLAIEPLEKSVEANKEFHFAKISLGDAYVKIDSNSKAEDIFNKVIEEGITDTTKNKFVLKQAFQKLSGMYLDSKNFSKLIDATERWASIFADDPMAPLYTAIAYHSQQNGPMACKYYRQVLKIEPDNASASKNLKLLQDAGQCQSGGQ